MVATFSNLLEAVQVGARDEQCLTLHFRECVQVASIRASPHIIAHCLWGWGWEEVCGSIGKRGMHVWEEVCGGSEKGDVCVGGGAWR